MAGTVPVRILFVLLLLTLPSWPAIARADGAFSRAVDAVFAQYDGRNTPGCAIGVVQDGEFLHKAAYGMADLEAGDPLTTRSVFRIASVSKQFTGMAVQLLADEGRIDLAADIRRYLPDLMDYGEPVTIEAVLGHVAGMGDYDWLDEPEAWPAGGGPLRSADGGPIDLGDGDYLTISEFYDAVRRVDLEYPPETRFLYSNLGYFLLSILIERVSGETLRAYAQRRIFGPLGMTRSFFNDDARASVPEGATGYALDDNGKYRIDMTNLDWVGDGGVHTSIEDFIRWDRNFSAPLLGRDPARLIERMNTPNSRFGDDGDLYANGQSLTPDPDGGSGPVFHHSGSWLGASAYYARYPADRFSVFVFCNDADADAEGLGDEVAGIFFARR